jgi:hypothetical protein
MKFWGQCLFVVYGRILLLPYQIESAIIILMAHPSPMVNLKKYFQQKRPFERQAEDRSFFPQCIAGH